MARHGGTGDSQDGEDFQNQTDAHRQPRNPVGWTKAASKSVFDSG
jgi:hypothetical protein